MSNMEPTGKLAISYAFERLSEAEEELGELDAAIGDGDHGAGMVRGMHAAVETETDEASGPYLAEAGMNFADAAGGASGALVGTFIMTLGQSLPDRDDEVDASALHEALQSALEALQRLGKAEPGDKTMVDTLDPFVQALGQYAEDGSSLTKAWEKALEAAEEGAQATENMVSRKGRSSKLGDRTRGHRDPGAISMLYVLQSVGRALQERCGEG